MKVSSSFYFADSRSPSKLTDCLTVLLLWYDGIWPSLSEKATSSRFSVGGSVPLLVGLLSCFHPDYKLFLVGLVALQFISNPEGRPCREHKWSRGSLLERFPILQIRNWSKLHNDIYFHPDVGSISMSDSICQNRKQYFGSKVYCHFCDFRLFS